ARPEVPLDDHVGSGAEAVACEGKHYREARIAQAARLRAVGGTEQVEQRLLDRVFANQRHAKVSREGASQRGLARAGKACDENEVSLAHLDEFASLWTACHVVWTCSTGLVPREADLAEPD